MDSANKLSRFRSNIYISLYPFQCLIFLLKHNELAESKSAIPLTASCGVPHQYCAHVPKLSATITWELKCRKIY